MLLLTLTSAAQQGLASTSFYKQLVTLRFGEERTVEAIDGELDIRSLRAGEIIHARGEAIFVPSQFLDPNLFNLAKFKKIQKDSSSFRYQLNPKSWDGHQIPSPATYGSFVLRILNDFDHPIAIKFPRFYHPAKVFVSNQSGARRVISLGEPSPEPSQSPPMRLIHAPIPSLDNLGNFFLIAHVSSQSSTKHPNRLNLSTFYIGSEQAINKSNYYQNFSPQVLCGAFFIIFLYFSAISIFRPSDISTLYLSLFAFCSFIIATMQVVDIGAGPEDYINLLTGLNVAAFTSLVLYLNHRIKPYISNRASYLIRLFVISIPLINWPALYVKNYLLSSISLSMAFLGSLGFIAATIYLGIRHRVAGVSFFILGSVGNLSFQFPLLIMYIKSAYDEQGYYIMLANFSIILGLAFVNAKEFAVTYRKTSQQKRELKLKNREISNFNENLEKLVEEKTREVRSLLDYIPQGVLSLREEGIIHPNYSQHLVSILEDDAIQGQSFREIVLNRSHLSEDAIDQAWQSILCSIGESPLNFEVNSDKLPREITYQIDDKKKYLKLTWNVEIVNTVVESILVTMLDISEEKKLETDAKKKETEMIRMQELAVVPSAKSIQFFKSVEPLLKEITQTLESAAFRINNHLAKNLFINVHTIKGAARTFGLKDLSQHLHNLEDKLLIEDSNSAASNSLQQSFENCCEVYQDYLRIHRDVLNRSLNQERINLERKDVEPCFHQLNQLLAKPMTLAPDYETPIRHLISLLAAELFEPLPNIVLDYEKKAAKIAKDLGKPAPLINARVPEIGIPPDIKTLLDHCMIHLLRNSLDHGIEYPDVRILHGKDPQGCITIAAEIVEKNLNLLIKDDGQGLAIERLRTLGATSNRFSPETSAEIIAETIFSSGTSTAQSVTQTSGRGVGMSAVRDLLRKKGGDILIVLGAPKDEHGSHYNFHFAVNIPLSTGIEELKSVA